MQHNTRIGILNDLGSRKNSHCDEKRIKWNGRRKMCDALLCLSIRCTSLVWAMSAMSMQHMPHSKSSPMRNNKHTRHPDEMSLARLAFINTMVNNILGNKMSHKFQKVSTEVWLSSVAVCVYRACIYSFFTRVSLIFFSIKGAFYLF